RGATRGRLAAVAGLDASGLGGDDARLREGRRTARGGSGRPPAVAMGRARRRCASARRRARHARADGAWTHPAPGLSRRTDSAAAPGRRRGCGGSMSQRTLTATLGRKGYTTVMTARGHTLVADEPLEIGGTDVSASPYEYLM